MNPFRITSFRFLPFLIFVFSLTVITDNVFAFNPDVFKSGESILYLVGTEQSDKLILSVDQEESGEISDNRAIFLRLKSGVHTIGIYGNPESRIEILFEPLKAYFLSYDPLTGFIDVIPSRAVEVTPLNYPFQTTGGTPDNTPIAKQEAAPRKVFNGYTLADLTESNDEHGPSYSNPNFVGIKYGLYGMSWVDRGFEGAGRHYKPLEPGFGLIFFSPPNRIAPYLAWNYELDASYDSFKHYHEHELERTTIQAGLKLMIADMTEGHPGFFGGLTVGIAAAHVNGYSPMVLGDSDRMFFQASQTGYISNYDYNTGVLLMNSRDIRSDPLVLAYFWNARDSKIFDLYLFKDLMDNGYYDNPIAMLDLYSRVLTGESLITPETRIIHAQYFSNARMRKMNSWYRGAYVGAELNFALLGLYLSLKPSVYILNNGKGDRIDYDHGSAELGLYVKI